jgi:protein-L-isoaspartate(D-aspartate) O-methyltransferase
VRRYGRSQTLAINRDVLDDGGTRDFLMMPRAEFTLTRNQGRACDHASLDIGFGMRVDIYGGRIVPCMPFTR